MEKDAHIAELERALESFDRGMAALTERMERLEREVLPREPDADLGFDDLERPK